MRRFGKFLLWLAGALVLLLLLFHGIENWRGRRAWEAWKQARIAAGDRYDWPPPAPPVPDAENFAAVPEVALAVRPEGGFTVPIPDFPDRVDAGRGWRHGAHEDLRAWRKALKSQDLDQRLQPAAHQLEILTAASRRPNCRFPHDVRKGELPAMLGFRRAGKLLRLRALDHLAHGRVIEAREDVVTLLRIAKHMESDPTLISALLASAQSQFAVQPLWEGLADHRWHEADLQILQEELEQVDLLRAFGRAWALERMWGILSTEEPSLEQVAQMPFWRRGECLQGAMAGDGQSDWRTYVLGAVVPSGWIYQNLLARDRFWVETLEPCLDPGAHRYYPARVDQASAAVEAIAAKSWDPYRYALAITLPALLGQNQKAALNQTALDQVRVACALERHRIRSGAYPDSLAELVPVYLKAVPEDIPAGGPLLYRREGRGYVLYSRGVDGKDDGGRIVENPKSPAGILAEQGDWVWRIPAY